MFAKKLVRLFVDKVVKVWQKVWQVWWKKLKNPVKSMDAGFWIGVRLPSGPFTNPVFMRVCGVLKLKGMTKGMINDQKYD